MLFFAKSGEDRDYGCVIDAMLLRGRRHDFFDSGERKSWVVSPQKKELICWQPAGITWMGTGSDETGRRTALFGGESTKMRVNQTVDTIAENSVRLKVYDSSLLEKFPFFLSETSDITLKQYTVRVRMTVKDFLELPDIQSYIEYLKLTAGTDAIFKRASDSIIEEFKQAASFAIGSSWLPIELWYEERKIFGAIRTSVPSDANECEASMYLEQDITLRNGMPICRSTALKFKSYEKNFSTQIGTIC